MFKRMIFVLSVLFLASFCLNARADVFVLSPAEQQLKPGTSMVLGSAQPGETVVFTISSKSGYGESFAWNSAIVPSDSLPEGWQFSGSESNPTHFVLKVSIPAGQLIGAYNFIVRAGNSAKNVSDEDVTMTVFVEKGLLKASLSDPKQEAIVNEPSYFKLTLVNDSIAEHSVQVSSTLPRYWFEPVNVTVAPKSIKRLTLTLNPRAYGKKQFQFIMKSNLSDEVFKQFDSELSINPTLRGKYLAPLYGFPALSPNLMPAYLLNSFIAMFWK